MATAVEQRSATDELLSYMDTPDPFRNAPDNLAELQLEAVRERFADMVKRVPVLARRAKEVAITEIEATRKSTPSAARRNGKWARTHGTKTSPMVPFRPRKLTMNSICSIC